MTDGGGTTTYAFDDDDNVTNKAVSFAGGPNANLGYSYYPDGSLASLATPAGGFSYSYDAGQRLTNLTNPKSQDTHYKYLNNDWLAGQTDWFGAANASNSITAGYKYDALGQITELANEKTTPNTVFVDDYSRIGYNGIGQLTGFSNFSGSQTGSYTYNGDNQLRTESFSGSGFFADNSYNYDNAGNPIEIRSSSGITYNADNGRTTLSFDGNGNVTSAGLTWDGENRVSAVGSAETNTYFSDGLRATSQTSSGKTFFLYDGGVPICELNSTGTATATNTWGPDGLVCRTAGGTTNYYVFDPQGNTAAIYNSSMTQTASYIYDAYGNQVSGSAANPPYDGFGAQYGYYQDSAANGWYLMGHRWYGPGQLHFFSRDPIGFAGGTNLYGYTGNDPMDEADPSGFDMEGVMRDQNNEAFSNLDTPTMMDEAPCPGAGPWVIGQNMDRVIAYARKIGGRYYQPRNWNPFDTKANLRRNVRWIRGIKSRGEDIRDIGHDEDMPGAKPGYKTPAPYYPKEQEETSDYPNLKFDPQPGSNGTEPTFTQPVTGTTGGTTYPPGTDGVGDPQMGGGIKFEGFDDFIP